MGMRLNADLVVLSACDTGRGQTTGGGDVLGLTRGLLAAGARAAVVSLWPVDDVSTSLLMGAFYRHLRAGATPAAVLQAAQRYLRALTPEAISEELAQLAATLRQAGASDRIVRPVEAAANEQGVPRHLVPSQARQSPGYQHPYFWAPFVLVG
jgi:CHAT domain-containing protein